MRAPGYRALAGAAPWSAPWPEKGTALAPAGPAAGTGRDPPAIAATSACSRWRAHARRPARAPAPPGAPAARSPHRSSRRGLPLARRPAARSPRPPARAQTPPQRGRDHLRSSLPPIRPIHLRKQIVEHLRQIADDGDSAPILHACGANHTQQAPYLPLHAVTRGDDRHVLEGVELVLRPDDHLYALSRHHLRRDGWQEAVALQHLHHLANARGALPF